MVFETATIIQVALVVAPVLLASVWGWFKRKDYISDKAEKALEAGVLLAWNAFGKNRKAELVAKFIDPEDDATDAKFTGVDKANLRSIAKETASKVLSEESGLDLKKIIKSDLLQDLAIKKIVDRLKS